MKKTLWTLVLLLGLVLLAGAAMAHRSGGMMGGHGMMNDYDDNDRYGYCDRYDDADSDAVRAIKEKYAGQFEVLRKKMEAKRDEMHKARDNDATTMGEMNKLRDEMHAIKKEHRVLAGKVDDELEEKFGDDDDDEGHHGWMHDRGHRRGGMMRDGYAYGGCR